MWQNLKVIELASVLAGPLVGSFFAELGAKVIKIENKKTNGDVTRQWKLATENKNNSISAYFAAANYNKESIFLDLTIEDDFKQLLTLIKSADIIIQNFKAGDAKKLNLDNENLLKLNKQLIIASINGYGATNKRPAFDVVLQAESGFMYMNGTPESGPVKMPVALIDILAAHHLKEAILIALVEKGFTGKGKVVNVSLFDAAIASLANQASNYLMEKHIPQAMGTQHPNIAPYGDMFLTKDKKHIVLAIGNNKQFDALCQVLDLKNELKTNEERLQNRTNLNEKIEQKINQFQATDLLNIFLEKNIPAGIVKNLEEVFNDKKTRHLIINETIEGIKTKKVKTLLQ